jgi:DNA topoisomerase VI subunit B
MVDVATITVPLLGKQTDAAALAADPEIAAKIRDALDAYARFLA